MQFGVIKPSISIIKEPMIKVGNNIELPDPKLGLSLFGTYQEEKQEINIKIGIIGDSNSIENANEFFKRIETEIEGHKQNLLHIGFPGLETDSKLNIKLSFNEKWDAMITDSEVESAVKKDHLHERIEETVEIIEQKVKNISDREPTPDVIIVALPEKFYERCVDIRRGKRKLPWKSYQEKRIIRSKTVNQSLGKWGVEIKEKEVIEITNLRSYMKGECMKYSIPTQIILPRTFENKSTTQDHASIVWNLITGLIYKANHIPWKVSGLDQNKCYMGIAFYRDRKYTEDWMRTSLAQVFSLSTEGLVLKGNQVPVDRDTNSPHLAENDAENLIRQAIQGYKEQTGFPPKRLVLHKTSRFNEAELKGFRRGGKDINQLELIALGTRGFKLIRWGNYPPLRGTVVKLPDKSVLLYTQGYIPYLDTYPGLRVPSPLEILEHHGNSKTDKICHEILALTKMNWNNASFCCRAPITISFAQKVGDILRETPSSIEPKTKFRYYM